ncbi:hypothetical protein [Gordonia sp. SMJS1]|uniref:hypothetical protein n=1 Tax=Gordonia sp. SMJS1 TaxID=3039400 RepID=UPI002454F2ED|nr:hypothetical protein [Gordonia sp. SMJS1]WGJ88187.1 hypothetical protein QAD21_24690 [Gordonia sp. SMJS1]
MLRVYLDQFAWIGLAKAAHGRSDGAPYSAALEMCRAARTLNAASFPLDLYRYWETAKNHVAGSRNRLADTMIELSDFDTITIPPPLLPYEIDTRLQKLFGRPTDVAVPRIFGRGIEHLTAGGVDISGPRPASTDKSSDLRKPIDRLLEEALLRAGPDTHARVGQPLNADEWGKKFVQHEVTVAQAIAGRGVEREDLPAAVVHSDYEDIAPVIRERVLSAGLTLEGVTASLGGAGILRLVESLPTRRVTNALRLSKHLHPPEHQTWRPNDFIDVVQLPVPTVYCDVVFTEKQWVEALSRERLDEQFRTTLISKPEQLVEVLAAATGVSD